MSLHAIHEKYTTALDPTDLTPEDLARASEFLQNSSAADLRDWADQKTTTYELNGQNYRMVVDRPDGGDATKAVVVAGEFGNGISPAVAARAQVVRDTVAPEATLVIQPNTTYDQDNLNFSKEERRQLRAGNLSPMLGRIALTLDDFNDLEDLTLYGPSQGGTVSLGYAAEYAPSAAVAVVEAPNVLDRSSLKMAADFNGCGAQLKDVIGENYEDQEAVFMQQTIADLSLAGMARFVRSIARPDNLAMIGVMRRDTASEQIGTILREGGGVVQAYGTVDSVSPRRANRMIADAYGGASSLDRDRYRSVLLQGSDHSVTNHYALNGALARKAHRLTRR